MINIIVQRAKMIILTIEMISTIVLIHGDDEHPIGPYIVLDDGSTYGSTYGAVVCWISEKGEEELQAYNDFKAVSEENAMYVSVRELLNCWASVHGIE